MREAIELPSREALVAHLAQELALPVSNEDVRVSPYGFDARIGWDTHIVTVRNRIGDRWVFGDHVTPDYFGAVGFTDGPAQLSNQESNRSGDDESNQAEGVI